jgi:hypothetical protein
VCLRRLLGYFGLDVLFQIFLDISGALCQLQVQTDAITQRIKHVDVDFHYVKTVVRHGNVTFAGCSTAAAGSTHLNHASSQLLMSVMLPELWCAIRS